jgi:hypothetical protein
MQHINVLVLGHQFAAPTMWVQYLAQRFKQPLTPEVFHGPDRCVVVEVNTAHYRMVTKAPVHALRHLEDSYRVLLAQPVDVLLYFQSIFVELEYLNRWDFDIVSPLLAARPTCPPVFTLLNDFYCGESNRTLLSEEELNQYILPGSRVFRTAISYLGTTKGCERGADEVFDALLDLLDGMRT